MKNTRKKMLLSSVAMLLVALVALGSATYAWFTINKSVTAKEMQVVAATAKGLVITGNNGGKWGRETKFGQTDDNTAYTLNPVSLSYTVTANSTPGTLKDAGYYPQDVASEGAYVAAAGNDPASATKWTSASFPTVSTESGGNTDGTAKATNNYFAAYRVGIKSTSGTIADAITATVGFTDATAGTSKSASDFIRVLVIKQGSSPANISAANDEVVASVGTGASAVWGLTGSGAAAVPDSTKITAQPNESTSFTIAANKIGTTAQYYTILVWYEGQDADCINGGQAASGKITLNFAY